MNWGNGMSGWGMLLMTVSNLLFWGLVIAGIVLLVRHVGRAGQPGSRAHRQPRRRRRSGYSPTGSRAARSTRKSTPVGSRSWAMRRAAAALSSDSKGWRGTPRLVSYSRRARRSVAASSSSFASPTAGSERAASTTSYKHITRARPCAVGRYGPSPGPGRGHRRPSPNGGKPEGRRRRARAVSCRRLW
jgi:hypothetical protein